VNNKSISFCWHRCSDEDLFRRMLFWVLWPNVGKKLHVNPLLLFYNFSRYKKTTTTTTH